MKNCCGESITLLGTTIAIQIFECMNQEDITVLAALLTVIADQLTLMTAANDRCSNKNNKNDKSNNSNKNSKSDKNDKSNNSNKNSESDKNDKSNKNNKSNNKKCNKKEEG